MLNVWIYNGKNNINIINGKRTKNRIDGTYTRGKNLIPTCRFRIYPNNSGYNKLVEYSTLIRIFDDDGRERFGGRVVAVNPSLDSGGVFYKDVTCEGWMGYLNDSISYWYGLYDRTRAQVLLQLLNHHNSVVNEDKAIQFSYSGEERQYIDYNYFNIKTFEAITNEEMLSTGYTYEVVEDIDNNVRTLECVHTIDIADETIELGKNLESVNVQFNFEDICTRVIPTTKDGVGLGNISEGKMPYVDADDSAIEKFGIIMRVHDFEGVSNVDKLQAAAEAWIAQNSTVKACISLSAVDLFKLGMEKEEFDLYRFYKIICPQIGLNEYMELTQITTDLNDEWNKQLTFGEKKYKATQYRRI